VSYNKRRLHKVGYFADLMSTQEEISQSVRPLLRLSREHIERAQKLDYALVSSLERDPLLKERLRRLRTVPGVGPITALTWALEIGDYTRLRSVKEAISYCGLCADEKSSADKVMRMPLSRQRNKHIQRVLVEAAKLAPRQCRLPGPAGWRLSEEVQASEALCELFQDWQRTHTQSSVTAPWSPRPQMDVWFCTDAGTLSREAYMRSGGSRSIQCALSRARHQTSRFLLTTDLHGCRHLGQVTLDRASVRDARYTST
jgi:hypothetical protein